MKSGRIFRTISFLSRPIALFFGVFSLLNIIGQLVYPGFDANHWWIGFRRFNPPLCTMVLTATSVLLILFSAGLLKTRKTRFVTFFLCIFLLIVCAYNILEFYFLLERGVISSGFLVPFSFFVVLALALVSAGLLLEEYTMRSKKSVLLFWTLFLFCVFGFAYAQVFCFGKTDYRRKADAVVIFGARVYASGRLSDALMYRVRTGYELYKEGLVEYVIFSGGPGDGDIHETEAMRTAAIKFGVPEDAIILDKKGFNTEATVESSCRIFQEMGFERVLAVSTFYHLPRIKMTYQRHNFDVYTVPSRDDYMLSEMPKYILREIAALCVYYIRPLFFTAGFE